MSNHTLLPLSDGVRVEAIASSANAIHISMTAVHPTACCSLCRCPSQRVHSQYERTLADLPWGQVAVRIRMRARRFFCDNPTCQRRIFAEPLTGLADRYAHKTQ